MDSPNRTHGTGDAPELRPSSPLQTAGALERGFSDAATRYRDLFEHSGLGSIVMGKDGTFLEVNELAARRMGRKVSEIVGRTLRDVFPLELADAYLAANLEVITSGVGRTYETSVALPEGSRVFHVHDEPVRDASGAVVGLQSTSIDITGQLALQTQLQASHRRLATLLDSIPDPAWMKDSSSRYLAVNSPWCECLGLERAQVLGRRGAEFLPAEIARTWEDKDRELIASRRSDKVEQLLPHAKWGLRWFEVCQTAFFDSHGAAEGTLGIARDITERKQAEMALQTERQRLDSIIEGARIGTWEWNVQTGEIILNERWANMLGYTLAELSPTTIRTWLEHAHPDDVRTSEGLLQRHFLGELAFYDCEVRMRHKDGRWVWVRDHGRVATRTEDGKPLWVRGVHTDITEHKRRDAYRILVQKILTILSDPGEFRGAIQHALTLVQAFTEVDAVGLRLQQGEGFPYFAQIGFTGECLRPGDLRPDSEPGGGGGGDAGSRAGLECTCALVLSGRTDPADSLFTRGGSAWTNDASALLKLPAGQDPLEQRRGACFRRGFSSVALIPIRAKDRVIGLLQLNHRTRNHFIREEIGVLEDAAQNFGEALLRKKAEEDLQRHAAQLEARNEELSRFNRLTIGREVRMIELKQEVNALCRVVGLPERYAQEAAQQLAQPRISPASVPPVP